MSHSLVVRRAIPALFTLSFAAAPLAAHAASISQVVTKHAITGPYTITLQIGPPEKMLSMGETPQKGEMMVGGKNATCRMKGMGGMGAAQADAAMQTCNHHVEVHVLRTSLHKAVIRASVSITMTDSKKHMTIHVPIMAMYDPTVGVGDYHYGNNVYAAPGTYSVLVTVNGKRASFSVHLR